MALSRSEIATAIDALLRTGAIPTNEDWTNIVASLYNFCDDDGRDLLADPVTQAAWEAWYNDLPEKTEHPCQAGVFRNSLVDLINKGHDEFWDYSQVVGLVVDSISDIRDIDYTRFQTAQALGYYTAGDDGGGPPWFFDTLSSDVDDGYLTLVPTGAPAIGRWKRTIRGRYRVAEAGYIADWDNGLQSGTDNTDAIMAVIDAVQLAGGGFVDFPAGPAAFASLDVPTEVILRGVGERNTRLVSTSTTDHAIELKENVDTRTMWNGVVGMTISASTARTTSGTTWCGIYAKSGADRTAYKITLQHVAVDGQPGDTIYLYQPEQAYIANIVAQLGKARGFVVDANTKGIGNTFINVRAYDNDGMPIYTKTDQSVFQSCEALVEGASPKYTGVLWQVAGNGNVIIAPDVELIGDPTEGNILATTGIQMVNDRNQLISGFCGNCGLSVDVRGRGSVINFPRTQIYSSLASNPVSGSIGIQVATGALHARLNVEQIPAGTDRVETYVSDLATADDTRYEWPTEFVWTPTIFGSTAAGTPTYGSRFGTGERFGTWIIARFQITLTSKTGISGEIRIGGLPYTVEFGAVEANGASVIGNAKYITFTGKQLVLAAVKGTEYCALRQVVSGGDSVAITDSDIANNTVIDGQIFYRIHD